MGYFEIDYQQAKIQNLSAIVFSSNGKTKSMLKIESKNYNENENLKKYSLCCSKLSHLNKDYLKANGGFNWQD